MRIILSLICLFLASISFANESEDKPSMGEQVTENYQAAKTQAPIYWDASKTWVASHWRSAYNTSALYYAMEKKKIKDYLNEERADEFSEDNNQQIEHDTINQIEQQDTIDPLQNN